MQKVRKRYRVEGPLAFLHVNLLDNRSEFLAPLRLRVFEEGDHVVIEAFGAVAIANSIAYLSELLDPISVGARTDAPHADEAIAGIFAFRRRRNRIACVLYPSAVLGGDQGSHRAAPNSAGKRIRLSWSTLTL